MSQEQVSEETTTEEASDAGVIFEASHRIGEQVMRVRGWGEIGERPVYIRDTISRIRVLMGDAESYRVEYQFEGVRGWHDETRLQAI